MALARLYIRLQFLKKKKKKAEGVSRRRAESSGSGFLCKVLRRQKKS